MVGPGAGYYIDKQISVVVIIILGVPSGVGGGQWTTEDDRGRCAELVWLPDPSYAT